MLDAAVKDLVVTPQTRFENGGRIFSVVQYRFFVGDHGPFTVEFNSGEDDVEKVQEKINAQVEKLRQIGALKASA